MIANTNSGMTGSANYSRALAPCHAPAFSRLPWCEPVALSVAITQCITQRITQCCSFRQGSEDLPFYLALVAVLFDLTTDPDIY
jgi:hypothetical protein